MDAKTITFEKFQTLRVNLDAAEIPMHGLYVLVVPDPKNGPNFRDFYLVEDKTGYVRHMFGLQVESDQLAAEIAAWRAPDHLILIEELREWERN